MAWEDSRALRAPTANARLATGTMVPGGRGGAHAGAQGRFGYFCYKLQGPGIRACLQMELSSVVDFDQGFGGIIWDTAFIVDALTGMPAGGRGPVRLATSVLST